MACTRLQGAQGTRHYSAGIVNIDASVLGAGAADPTAMRGEGVATWAYVSTGKYLVTLLDSCRYVVTASASVAADSSGDGAYATVGAISNEASSTAISFNVFTHAAGGSLTNYTSRRIGLRVVLKNSGVGK